MSPQPRRPQLRRHLRRLRRPRPRWIWTRLLISRLQCEWRAFQTAQRLSVGTELRQECQKQQKQLKLAGFARPQDGPTWWAVSSPLLNSWNTRSRTLSKSSGWRSTCRMRLSYRLREGTGRQHWRRERVEGWPDCCVGCCRARLFRSCWEMLHLHCHFHCHMHTATVRSRQAGRRQQQVQKIRWQTWCRRDACTQERVEWCAWCARPRRHSELASQGCRRACCLHTNHRSPRLVACDVWRATCDVWRGFAVNTLCCPVTQAQSIVFDRDPRAGLQKDGTLVLRTHASHLHVASSIYELPCEFWCSPEPARSYPGLFRFGGLLNQFPLLTPTMQAGQDSDGWVGGFEDMFTLHAQSGPNPDPNPTQAPQMSLKEA